MRDRFPTTEYLSTQREHQARRTEQRQLNEQAQEMAHSRNQWDRDAVYAGGVEPNWSLTPEEIRAKAEALGGPRCRCGCNKPVGLREDVCWFDGYYFYDHWTQLVREGVKEA